MLQFRTHGRRSAVNAPGPSLKKGLAERGRSGKPGKSVSKRQLRLLVTAVEFVDTARRVDEFLLAGEKRVALRADTDLVLGAGGFDMPDFTARAGHDGIFVLRMDVLFHFAQLRFAGYIIKVLLLMHEINNLYKITEVTVISSGNQEKTQ